LKLIPVPKEFIDKAWKEGAWNLAEACEQSGGEVEIGQLKMMLSRGERTLLRMDDETGIVGWGVVRIDQLPNIKVLHACELYAPDTHFERFFEALKAIAESLGCSRIRCSAKPVQARLYKMKCGFTPVYETLEVVLT
jgi:hypothetical protein